MEMNLRRKIAKCPKCSADGAELLEQVERVFNRTTGRWYDDATPAQVYCESCGGADGLELARLRGGR